MNEAKDQHTAQAENPEIFTGIRSAAPKDVARGAYPWLAEGAAEPQQEEPTC